MIKPIILKQYIRILSKGKSSAAFFKSKTRNYPCILEVSFVVSYSSNKRARYLTIKDISNNEECEISVTRFSGLLYYLEVDENYRGVHLY